MILLLVEKDIFASLNKFLFSKINFSTKNLYNWRTTYNLNKMAQVQNTQNSSTVQIQQQVPPDKGEQPTQMSDSSESPKSRWWIWLLVAVVLLGARAGYYFFLM